MKARAEIPVLSGAGVLGQLRDFRERRLELQLRMAHECGDIGWFRMGPIPVLMISGPELTQLVLVEHAYEFSKSRALAKYGRPLLGAGLLTAEGAAHKRQRKLLAPAFQHARVAAYADAMAAYAENAVRSWTDGQRLDLAHEMTSLTLAIVGKTLFDSDVTHDTRVIGWALTDAMRYMMDSLSTLPLPYWWPSSSARSMRRAVAALDEVVYRIIRGRRSEGTDHGDVLSALLAARDGAHSLSDLQVRDEVMTLVLAGHETTANALAWTWHLLLGHPVVYARLQDEIGRTLRGRTPRYADLGKMPISLAILKESMRLYPPAYLIGRRALRNVRLGRHSIRRGTFVMVNVYGMQRRADLFRGPELFRVERFLGDAEQRLPRGAYIPFAAGARVCIGNHFALMEAQLLLTTIAQRVQFVRAGPEQIEAEPLVTLRLKGGLPVLAKTRPAG